VPVPAAVTLPVHVPAPAPISRPLVMTPPPVPVLAPRWAVPEPVVVAPAPAPVAMPAAAGPGPVADAFVSAEPTAKTSHEETIVATIAELTGYPVEMIEPDMELEAGLGIDSIKKVEIFSALQAKIPAFSGVDTGQLATLTTPRAIVAFTQKLTGTAGGPEKN
jgi:hypothetical protein